MIKGLGAWGLGLTIALVIAGTPRVHANATVADAAKSGDATTVKALLKQGVDVNAAQGDGMTALHWAATNGDVAMTQMLLSAGANVRATTRLGGITALHLATQGGQAQVVAALIAGGAEPNLATALGATPLMLAARSGNTETVTRLVEVGADINAKEKVYGQTALMVAAGLDRADVVRLLLAKGADWKMASSVVDLKALTAPIDGEGRGGPAAGAPAARVDVPGVTRGYRYNELIGAQGGLTALHFAVRQGSANAVRALAEGGVDLNVPSPGDHATPLLVALINGHFDVASYLVEKGANPNLLSDAGVSPLYATLNVQWAPIAAYPQPRAHLQQSRGYLDMMKQLLDQGADPNARVRRKVWYSGYNFDQSGVDEVGATPFWRGLCGRSRGHEAVSVVRRRSAHPHHQAVLAARPRRPGGRCRQVGLARAADWRPRRLAAISRRRPRLFDRLRGQLASPLARRLAAGREVSGRRTRFRCEHRRPGWQHGGAQRRGAWRHGNGALPGVKGCRREALQSRWPDDYRRGERPNTADAAVSRDH